ncbi:MAG: hypothetical protein K8E66_03055 [Phycisphaerales bacterium]|nr:hypothetical protein [Phycisphaerales bacterium]
MILADASVWVDHFRRGNPQLREALETDQIVMHQFIEGELTLGHVKRRGPLLQLVGLLPALDPASHDEVLGFVTDHTLEGSGIGWVDAHLLAASLIHGASLWTLDKKLNAVAARHGLA